MRSEQQNNTGEYVAKLFKYYRQYVCGLIKYNVSIQRISAKQFYRSYQKYFDNLLIIFNKKNLNIETYIKFFICELGKTEKDISSSLVSYDVIYKYFEYLSGIEKKKYIFNIFMKSVNEMTKICLENNFVSSKDCLKYLIKEKKLASLFIAGKITKYYLAAIPGITKIIPKLDYFSKIELSEIIDKYEIYYTEIMQSFMYIKNCKINVFEFTDKMISNARPEYIKKKTLESLFDNSII